MTNPNHFKNCTGWLRGKGKSTSHYNVWCEAQVENRVPKGVVQKTRLVVNGSKYKMLASIKCYVKLQQHFSFRITYCYLNISEISCRFYEVEDASAVLVYLLKYKFYLGKNWIFLAIYKIQKSKAKTCFSQN